MKYQLITGALLSAFITLTTNSAFATVNRDAVVSDKGTYVLDSFGGCVRTETTTAGDPCEVKAYKVVTTRTEAIDKIMKMDERIVHFAFDKSELTAADKVKIQVVAKTLKEHDIKTVKIVGFTDKIGSEAYNQALSEKRANAVKTYLNSIVKLDESIVDIRGLGKSHQVKDCNEVHARSSLISCLAPNRRVEIEVDYYDYN